MKGFQRKSYVTNSTILCTNEFLSNIPMTESLFSLKKGFNYSSTHPLGIHDIF
jgi:hypothetical protein